ncbi:MAG: Xaa-Pro peptidase family protein [Maledivibacter sp.]|nr:Xaa-Pro peptidase family protein [Maledivibacter sp.]
MIDELISMMKEEYIDGFFISNPSNVQYITGYREEHVYAVITKRGQYLIIDGRYKELAAMECLGFEILVWNEDGRGLTETINDIVIKDKVNRLGFEAEYITYKQFTELYDIIKAEITPVIGLVEQLRVIKTPEEISYLRQACDITERAYNNILNDIKVGISEKELVAKANYYLRIEGGDPKTSETVFLSGKRSSLIVALPTDKKIEYGDFVLINIGARYKGYLVDFSRTVVVGEPTERQEEIYSVVQKAQMEAIKGIKGGVLAKEPYYASKKVLEEAGYLKYHYKKMGHGIGLFLYEEPFLCKSSKNILVKNNVLTVEPGIYIPGWGGVRIEDVILVTEDGYEILTKTPRDLMIL